MSVRRSDGAMTRTCSQLCARRLLLANGWKPANTGRGIGRDPAKVKLRGELSRRRRRARLANVASEPYTLAEIAERGGFRCGLCRRKVDMAKAWPAKGSASVDHIAPLAIGGDDTRSNVQLAHFGCNLKKSAKAEYPQALLIG